MDLQKYSDFLLTQRITLLVNRYDYFLYEGGIQGAAVAFAEQKRFSFREHVTIWQNEQKNTKLCTIRAEKLLDVHGKFLVHGSQNELIGYCRKSFRASLVCSTWEVCAPDDTLLFSAREKSQAVAIARRFAQFIPYLQDIAGFIPFNFTFEKDGIEMGTHARLWGSWNDRYTMHLSPSLKDIDRHLPLALGILLDALQDR